MKPSYPLNGVWGRLGLAFLSMAALSPAIPAETAAAPGIDFEAARKHWAYRPNRRPELPAVRDLSWPAAPLDRFILAKLEAIGLAPSPPADRRALLRRVSIDLTGLPPAAEEVDAFLGEASPDAFAKVVDHLLESPHYGERWGRHWLDVARYADTKDGVLMYGDDRVRPYAYTYRDYVIRAINEDVPFDRFIEEQLAADQIEPEVEPWRLAAMGFLTLGRMFDNNIHDIIDDQIDTVSRGFLGLTVACARCHDHKYDAIAMSDYYSLYGVFASSAAPLELPLIDAPEKFPGGADFEKQAEPKRREVKEFLDKQYTLLSETARLRAGDYLERAAATEPDPLETAIYFLSLAPEDLRPPMVARWRRYLEVRAVPDDPVFGIWRDLMALPEEELSRPGAAEGILNRWKSRERGVGAGQVNPLILEALSGASLTSRGKIARAFGDLFKRVYEESKASPANGPASGQSPPAPAEADDGARRQILEIVAGQESPAYFPKSQTRRYMSRAETDAFGGKLQEIDRMAVKSPGAPPRAMVLIDAPDPQEPRLFLRGNPSRPGERVPRQFLRLLRGEPARPFTHGSGRLDLARAIAAPDNPLTARVIVNRVWMHHFGEPLAPSPSDFGTRSPPPEHAELLDYLAWRFVNEGWSLKKLHRWILLSSTYRQASFDRPEGRRKDPENRLLWRMQRRRLDWEAMRDSLLFISGQLNRRLGGRPENIADDPINCRRTVYGLVDRQSLPAVYRAFDFAVPDQSVERRPQTSTPQQALFGMNSAFVIEQAKALSARPEIAGQSEPKGRIAALHRLVFARPPEDAEMQAGLQFVAGAGAGATAEKSPREAWRQYAQVLLMSNESMFID
ncbi:MAG: DUF1553 domain-containing protein [Planctomycetes bacterium]|nr:DUF1553 domain-containing protein [Planctomycetota bacterium]